MSKRQPAPPPAPDFAAANREAIMTDLETLPERRRIEAEARLGLGDFAGLGDADMARAEYEAQLGFAPQAAQTLLQLQRDYGQQFAELGRAESRAADPIGFDLRQNFGQGLLSGDNTLESLVSGILAPEYESLQDSQLPQFAGSPNAPTLARLGGVTLGDRGMTAAGRAGLEQQVFDRLAASQGMDPMLQRAAEQAARARGASSGNLYGSGNALQEAMAVQMAQRDNQRQAQGDALALLGSGQSTSDTRNRLSLEQLGADQAVTGFNNATGVQDFQNRQSSAAFNNENARGLFDASLAAVNSRNNAAQQTFAGQQSLAGQQQAARSNDLANIQSFLGLQPVTAAAGLQSGGSAPFQSFQIGQRGQNVNANAGAQGAQFAQGVFGTQAGIYGNQLQNQSNPLATMGGALAGSFLGPFGQTLGGAAAGGLLKCHVARLVFGEKNPEWALFRDYLDQRAPRMLRRFYDRYSKAIAALIEPMPDIQRLVRNWMRSRIIGAY